jgi:uncharacterized membrane protein
MTLPSPASPLHDAVPAQPDAVVRGMRVLALTGVIGLVLLGLAWELWLAPTGSGTLAVKVLPLALTLPGLLRHRMYTYRWLSLLVWLYFMEGVVRAVTEGGVSQVLAVLEIALTLLLFAACTMYIRWRLRSAARRPEAA